MTQKRIAAVASLLLFSPVACSPDSTEAESQAAVFQPPADKLIDHRELRQSDYTRYCPRGPDHTVEIAEADPAIEPHHGQMLDLFISAVNQPNTTVILGPHVFLDFSNSPESIF